MNSLPRRQCSSSLLALGAALALGGCIAQPMFLIAQLPMPSPPPSPSVIVVAARTPEPEPAPVVQPLHAVEPPTFAFGWEQNLVAYRGHTGQQFTVQCPPNGTAGTVWGTDYYSDDSSVCTAAAHSGRVSLGQGGTVRVMLTAAGQSYVGTNRAGIATQNYGPWPGSFVLVDGPTAGLVATPLAPPTPPAPPAAVAVNFVPGVAAEVTWSTNVTPLRGRVGQEYLAVCPANGTAATVWGSQTFTDDSSLCTAAAHSGLLSMAQGGVVHFWMHPGRPTYVGSAQLGVTSQNYGAWPGTFAFSPEVAPAPPTPRGPHGSLALGWDATATQWRGTQNAVLVFCPPQGTASTIWGSGVYTDDSSVCSAAVHAGLFTLASGGVARVLPSGARGQYPATTRNGITSAAWESFEGSFSVRPASERQTATRAPVVVNVNALE